MIGYNLITKQTPKDGNLFNFKTKNVLKKCIKINYSYYNTVNRAESKCCTNS